MVDYRKMFWGCVLGSLLATGAVGALVAYSFGAAPHENERAPEPGQLNALLVSESPPASSSPVEVFVPPLGGLPGVGVFVDPEAGVDVEIVKEPIRNPACPPGGCPEPGTPAAYPSGDPTGYYEEDPADYDAYADGAGGGDGTGGRFLGKAGKLRGFVKKLIPTRKSGPLRRLCGRLCGGGR